MVQRAFLLSLVLSVVAGASPAAAATYCVSDPACPAGGIAEPDLGTALTVAGLSNEADTVRLGPGTYPDPGNAFMYVGRDVATNAITVQGAGPDQTILTQAATNESVLTFSDDTPSAKAAVTDLGVLLPAGFATNGAAAGIAYATQAANVRITAAGAVADIGTGFAAGDPVTGGFIAYSGLDVRLPATSQAQAVLLNPPTANDLITITDSSLAAGTGVSTTNSSRATIQRVRIDATSFGVSSPFHDDGSGQNVIEDSQIRTTGAARAITIFPQDVGGGDASLAIRHATLIGDGSSLSRGVSAQALSGNDANVRVRNSIVEGFAHPLQTGQSGGVTAALTASASVLQPSGDDSSGGGTITRTNDVETADAKLVDDGNGELYPLFDSPAIDLADPTLTFNTVDLARHSRTVDGNGDGNVLPDAGALEYQRRPPAVAASYVAPSTFAATGSDPDPGDTLAYSWVFSDSATASGQSVSHVFAPGPFGATVTATDPTGQSASATVTGAIPPPPPPPPPPAVPDTTAPALSGAAFSPKTFRASADTDTPTSATFKKKPVGSTLKLKLSEAATVTVVIAEKRSGRTQGSKCVAETKKNRKGKRCTFYTTRATLKRADLAAGSHSIQFTGRFKGKALKAASYQATLTAKDAAANTGKPVTATFTLAK